MNNVNNDRSVILRQQLDNHNMKKYEFKKIEYMQTPQKIKEKVKDDNNEKEEFSPSPTQISMIQSSLEKELIEKLLSKSDDLSNSLNNFQTQFENLQIQSMEREKIAREEGYKEGEMKAKLDYNDELQKEKERISKTLFTLNDTIENIKSQIIKLENELSAIALDIAKEIIIKEIDSNSAKIASLISKELLKSMSLNLNVVIKVNPLDFEFLDEELKENSNIKLKSDDAIARGGVIVISENGNVDGNIMSRYNILKQSVLDNFR